MGSTMNVDKIRNLTDIELAHQQRDMADQLFKMKFQLKMGQTESLKKIRELKKDIARVQTVLRQKELAGGNGAAASASNPVKKTVTAKKAADNVRVRFEEFGETIISGLLELDQVLNANEAVSESFWTEVIRQRKQFLIGIHNACADSNQQIVVGTALGT